MNNRPGPAFLAAALLITGTASAESREHGKHVHGIAELDVVKIDGDLAIDLRSPAMNIVGFEHEPGTDGQRRALAEALARLDSPAGLFGLPDGAECEATGSEAARVAEGDASGHGEHEEHDGREEHDGHDRERHSEIRASWRFACASPGALDAIDLRLFEYFPRTESVRVQLLTDTAQRASVLTPDRPRLEF